ncbi:hypothetical protein HAX54_042448, partial [Datura stramonium]|nr:hypothetical protein [Datura stramonium]
MSNNRAPLLSSLSLQPKHHHQPPDLPMFSPLFSTNQKPGSASPSPSSPFNSQLQTSVDSNKELRT